MSCDLRDRRRSRGVACVALALALAACSESERDKPRPAAPATAPTRASTAPPASKGGLSKALSRHREACEGGSGESCYTLAVFAEQGDPDGALPAMAPAAVTALYVKGCEAGYADACGPAGERQTPPGSARAHALWARGAALHGAACQKGDAEACRSVAMLHTAGKGVPQDDVAAQTYGQQAFDLFRAGCEANDMAACRGLGTCYHLGGCGPVGRDLVRASRLYAQACRGGDSAACRLAEHVP